MDVTVVAISSDTEERAEDAKRKWRLADLVVGYGLDLETEVLVVGAGPIGLALAIELGLHGIRTTVLEQQTRVGGTQDQ